MLIACQSCHRQYDVGDLEPRTRVRCACGRLNSVPSRRPRRPVVAYCANCGGARAGSSGPCEYCDVSPSAAERGLGDPCPECSARLAKGARFCAACGVEIRPAAVVKAISNRLCPRCSKPLVLAEGRGDPFHQCTGCGGIWLSLSAFQRFVDRSAGRGVRPEEQRSVARNVQRIRRRSSRRHRASEPALACPTCGGLTQRLDYATYSGVVVDHCRRHGWWFDGDELERIGRFVAGGGLEEVERRRHSARRSKRTAASWHRRVRAENRRQGLLGILLGLAAGSRR